MDLDYQPRMESDRKVKEMLSEAEHYLEEDDTAANRLKIISTMHLAIERTEYKVI
jgi:hypothetical protein